MDLKSQQKFYFSRLYKRMKFFQYLMLISVISLVVISPFLAREMSENKVIKKENYNDLIGSDSSGKINELQDNLSSSEEKNKDLLDRIDQLNDEREDMIEQLDEIINSSQDNESNTDAIRGLEAKIKLLESDLLAAKERYEVIKDEFENVTNNLKKCLSEHNSGNEDCEQLIAEHQKELEVCKEDLKDLNVKYKSCLSNKPRLLGISGILKPGQSLQLDKMGLTYVGARSLDAIMKVSNAPGFKTRFTSNYSYTLPNKQNITFSLVNNSLDDVKSNKKTNLKYSIK